MAAITDLSDLINRQTGGNSGLPENIAFHKVPRIGGAAATAPIAGRAASMWQYDGMPGAGALPGAASIPTRATQGAIPFVAPTGGREKHLISAGVTPLTAGVYLLYDRLFHTAGVYLLYDRLFHMSGLDGTLATAQTVQGAAPGTPALTRNTTGEGNIAFYEIYTAVGVTGRVLTMTYTNQAGVGSRTSTINIGATGFREATRMQRIPLQDGDSGIRSIQQIQLDNSTGTAGNFGITIARPLAWIPVGTAGSMGWRDFTTGLPGIPQIDPNACLALAYIPAAATASEIFGMLGTVEK